MQLVASLIIVPLIMAALIYISPSKVLRSSLVIVGSIVIAVLSLALVVIASGQGVLLIPLVSPVFSYVCQAISLLLAVVILRFSLQEKKHLVTALALLQLLLLMIFEHGFAHNIIVPFGLSVDPLSLLMTLIIGLIGPAICIYALGYMQDLHEQHPDCKDRQKLFFALVFVFLSAMFGIVFSNNLSWLLCAWEVTTVCSFLLIGYTRTEEALTSAFRQIWMNILGGIAFVIALWVLVIQTQSLSMLDLIEIGKSSPELVALPVTLLVFAGLTKAAQMPFHTWLLGAMVAPTPASALLHSSTMVKAGVFLLIKLSPLIVLIPSARILALSVGALTFLLCSCMAIAQTNAKRVLAYSTIANLGLIVICAGLGNAFAVWAACMLILFHALAKSLLFLCVGTAEHHIHSRDIESMDLLFERMPKLARLMIFGIMAMFIAPFGMLAAKWATILGASEAHNLILIVILGYGSALTFFFWAKWLGKLAGITGAGENIEMKVHRTEWVATFIIASLLSFASICMLVTSGYVVEPVLSSQYGLFTLPLSSFDLLVLSILSACIILLLLRLGKHSKSRKVQPYLSAASVSGQDRSFKDSFGQERVAQARNWYLQEYFGEGVINKPATYTVIALIVLSLVLACVIEMGVLPC